MITKNIGLIIHPEINNILNQIFNKNPELHTIQKIWEFARNTDDNLSEFLIWHEPSGFTSIHTWRENHKTGTKTTPQSVRIGRAIKDLFDRKSEKISEADVEKLVNAWKSLSDPSDIEIVKGEEIKFWYLRENYAYPGPAVRPVPNQPSPSIYGRARYNSPYILDEEERNTTHNTVAQTFEDADLEFTQRPQEIDPIRLQEEEEDILPPIQEVRNEQESRNDEPITGNSDRISRGEGNIIVDEVILMASALRGVVNNGVYTASIGRSTRKSVNSPGIATISTSGFNNDMGLFGSESSKNKAEEFPVKGSLSKSCMRYPECSPLLDIYTEHDDIFLMITKDDKGKLLSRALVWKLENGRMLMDRVYYSDESHIVKYESFAKSHGWDYAVTKYFPSERRWMVNNKLLSENDVVFKFKLKKDYLNWPYIDTFCYREWETGNLFSSKRYINTKTCLELHDIRGNSKLVSTKNNAPFIQKEMDWILENSDLKLLFKEGGIGMVSKESKEIILKKAHADGWDMASVLCPVTWQWDEWFEYIKKVCDRGCVVGPIKIKTIFSNEQWEKFVLEPRIKSIRYYMSLLNVPLPYAQYILKESGWDNRYIEIIPILLNLPDDMAIDYIEALKRVHPSNVIISGHKSNSLMPRIDHLLYSKRVLDNIDLDWLSLVFVETLRNDRKIDNKWILRLSEDDRMFIYINSIKKYSVDLHTFLDVAPYKESSKKSDSYKNDTDYIEYLKNTLVEKKGSSSKKVKYATPNSIAKTLENMDPIRYEADIWDDNLEEPTTTREEEPTRDTREEASQYIVGTQPKLVQKKATW